MNSRGVLIISGYNTRAVVAFCRFCRENNILFFIIAAGYSDSVLLTEYKKSVVEIRKTQNLSLDDFTEYKDKIIRDFGISELLILPSTEYLNRFILAERNSLESFGYIIPLCSFKLYEKISDKYAFSELCKSNNILVPLEYESIETVKIPFVAKPKKYFSSDKAFVEKPVIVTNRSEYAKFKNLDSKNFYFQEFVGGKSYYLLFYFSEIGTYSVFSQENLIQQSNGLSIIAAKSTNIHSNQISIDYAALFLRLGFSGLVMIEVKFFKDQFYMIEANPRLWGPSQLIIDSGMDLFEQFAFDNGLIDKLPITKYEIEQRYFWSGGIIEDQKKKYTSSFHNYHKASFFEEYYEWCKADIYFRDDTSLLFVEELKK